MICIFRELIQSSVLFVQAAYLQKAGVETAVLERRHVLGGAAVSEEIIPGEGLRIFISGFTSADPCGQGAWFIPDDTDDHRAGPAGSTDPPFHVFLCRLPLLPGLLPAESPAATHLYGP